MKPREKLLTRGSETLSDLELLAVTVGSGTVGRDYKRIANDILKLIKDNHEKGSICSADSLVAIKGVGGGIASRVLSGLELGRRLYDSSYRHAPKITSTEGARVYFDEIRLKSQEVLKAAFVNARFEMIAKETIGIGSVNAVGMHVRDIVQKCLLHNAYGVVVAHNHPSGDPTPSREDIEATELLRSACEMFDIKLIDHLILAKDGYASVPM